MNPKPLCTKAPLLIICITLMIIKVEAHNPGYIINAVYGNTPTIDGTINPTEWNDATTVTFNKTIVYIKQDATNLYIAFNISDATNDSNKEGALAFIDTNHDDGSLRQDDDVAFFILRDGTTHEMHGQSSTLLPPTNWTAALHDANAYYTFEFNITYTKLSITPNTTKTMGLLLEAYDYTPYEFSYWPPAPSSSTRPSPSVWGNLTSNENWIPELQTPVIITALFTTTTLTIGIRKKQRKNLLKASTS